MDVWVSGAILTLPALVPTLVSVVLTTRWLRLGCRADWRPGASVRERRLVIAGFAGMSLILCLVMLVGSTAVFHDADAVNEALRELIPVARLATEQRPQ